MFSFCMKCFAFSFSHSKSFIIHVSTEIFPIHRGLLCLHDLREITLCILHNQNYCLYLLFYVLISCFDPILYFPKVRTIRGTCLLCSSFYAQFSEKFKEHGVPSSHICRINEMNKEYTEGSPINKI